jgi:hypothetical protein
MHKGWASMVKRSGHVSASGIAQPSPEVEKPLPTDGDEGYEWMPLYNQSKTHPYNIAFRNRLREMVIENSCQPGSEFVRVVDVVRGEKRANSSAGGICYKKGQGRLAPQD